MALICRALALPFSVGRRRGRTTDLHAALADHRRYERQIDRLHQRHVLTRRVVELHEGGVSLASVAAHRREVARLLARTVAAGEYTFRPAELRTIKVRGRRRVVHANPLADQLVHGVVAEILEEAVAATRSPSLYSYVPGLPWWRAASDLATYVRAHRRARPDPRTRGLYVLRRDVDAYTDSIPVGPASPVWRMLDEAVQQGFPGEIRPADRELVANVVRPLIRAGGGEPPRRAERGVPTGQPVSCMLFNLYLASLDSELAAIPGAFYARYSDDIAFAHPDPAVARRAAASIDRHLADLGLASKAAKAHDWYLTGAGRLSTDWPDARGTTRVTLLGLDIGADGTIGLDRLKTRATLRDLRRRAAAVHRFLPEADLDGLGRLVCSLLAEAIDPDAVATRAAAADLLAHAVTDRRQLAQLDLQIARIAAWAMTGDRSARAFRRVPIRRLRDWGLPALVHARNVGAHSRG